MVTVRQGNNDNTEKAKKTQLFMYKWNVLAPVFVDVFMLIVLNLLVNFKQNWLRVLIKKVYVFTGRRQYCDLVHIAQSCTKS